MNSDAVASLKPTRAASWLALLLSSGTLVCCALPALLVLVGAGATLSTLIAQVPQLVWFSEHKAAVFAVAAAMLLASGAVQWRARRLPCPADPVLAQACARMRRRSLWIYLLSVVVFATGGFFAFVAQHLFY